MAAILRCTVDPFGMTTLPLLSFTSAETVPVSFWPALWVRELIPASNLAGIAVPEASTVAAGLAADFATDFAAGFAPGLAGAFGAALLPRSLSGALASTAGRCRSRSESSVSRDLSGPPPHPATRARVRNTSLLTAMGLLRNYWTGLPIGMQTGEARASPRPAGG